LQDILQHIKNYVSKLKLSNIWKSSFISFCSFFGFSRSCSFQR